MHSDWDDLTNSFLLELYEKNSIDPMAYGKYTFSYRFTYRRDIADSIVENLIKYGYVIIKEASTLNQGDFIEITKSGIERAIQYKRELEQDEEIQRQEQVKFEEKSAQFLKLLFELSIEYSYTNDRGIRQFDTTHYGKYAVGAHERLNLKRDLIDSLVRELERKELIQESRGEVQITNIGLHKIQTEYRDFYNQILEDVYIQYIRKHKRPLLSVLFSFIKRHIKGITLGSIILIILGVITYAEKIIIIYNFIYDHGNGILNFFKNLFIDNQTLSNQTVIDQTSSNQTIVNQTLSNQTIVNQLK